MHKHGCLSPHEVRRAHYGHLGKDGDHIGSMSTRGLHAAQACRHVLVERKEDAVLEGIFFRSFFFFSLGSL